MDVGGGMSVLGPGKGNQANLEYATKSQDMQNVYKNRNVQNMLNMQNMQNNMYKICNKYANKYAEYVNKYATKYAEYAKYAKPFSDMQNM